jgi:hypothetical protein
MLIACSSGEYERGRFSCLLRGGVFWGTFVPSAFEDLAFLDAGVGLSLGGILFFVCSLIGICECLMGWVGFSLWDSSSSELERNFFSFRLFLCTLSQSPGSGTSGLAHVFCLLNGLAGILFGSWSGGTVLVLSCFGLEVLGSIVLFWV